MTAPTCKTTGKLVYSSRYEAHVAKDKMRKKREKGPRLYVYRCPFCQGIHLSSDKDRPWSRKTRQHQFEDDSLEIGG